MNAQVEILDIITSIALDMNLKLSNETLIYLTEVVNMSIGFTDIKSVIAAIDARQAGDSGFKQISDKYKESGVTTAADIEAYGEKKLLFEIGHFSLLSYTIFNDNLRAKELYRKAAYKAYHTIFDKYTDDVAFEICSDIEMIEEILVGIKYYSIKSDIVKLLEASKNNSRYVKIRLAKMGYIAKMIEC